MEKIDREKILGKIQIIEGNLKKLYELQNYSHEEFSSDFRNIESAKHLLQTAIEAMIDIATHVVARYRLSTPSTSVETIKLLVENKIISAENEERYSEMIRFRNRLVHFYQRIDYEELYEIVQKDLPDFETFIKDIHTIINP